MIKKLSLSVVAVLALLAAVCCSKQVVHVESISLDKSVVSLIEGESLTIVATVLPQSAANKDVIWLTSNSKVAAVSQEGVVSAVSKGSAIITATTVDGGKSAICTVEVSTKEIKVTGVYLSDDEIELQLAQSASLTAQVTPENATNKNVSWSSSDESVAVVDENGVVTAVSEGEATIYVVTEEGGFSDWCEVNVVPERIPVESVSLESFLSSMYVGDEYNFVATVLPENATNKNVVWASSNENVAVVDENGKVTALSIGMTLISATSEDGGKFALCAVIVLPRF